MFTIVKIDLDSLINSKEKIIIELGCGARKKEGRIGIDAVDLPCVDIVADLEKGLAFLPDNSVDQIHCKHFLEHIKNFENLMAEMVRVLKRDGTANISVPHFSNPYYYSDYTHKRFFGLYSFYYFADNEDQPRRALEPSAFLL